MAGFDRSGDARGRKRLQADIHRLLSTLMQRDVADPRLAGLTITRLELAESGRVVHVWVYHGDTGERRDCVRRLDRLAPHFRHELRRALPRRRIPEIRFHWDSALEDGGRVLDLLRQLDRES